MDLLSLTILTTIANQLRLGEYGIGRRKDSRKHGQYAKDEGNLRPQLQSCPAQDIIDNVVKIDIYVKYGF
jgi:hypothetical protein